MSCRFSLEDVGNVHHRIRSFEVKGNKTGCNACHGLGKNIWKGVILKRFSDLRKPRQEMASSWDSYMVSCVILLYVNHRLVNIMSGPNYAETIHCGKTLILVLLELKMERRGWLD